MSPIDNKTALVRAIATELDEPLNQVSWVATFGTEKQ